MATGSKPCTVVLQSLYYAHSKFNVPPPSSMGIALLFQKIATLDFSLVDGLGAYKLRIKPILESCVLMVCETVKI